MSATPHRGQHRAPTSHLQHFSIGVLDLHKLTSMFYQAGWWIAQAQSSHIQETPALENDWRVMVMHVAIPLTGLYHPSTMEVVNNPQIINHNADALAAGMLKIFLQTLHEHGREAANRYAAAMGARSADSQRRVVALYKQAGDHNAALEHQANEIAYGLADTITVCEVVLAVGVCVLTLGAAPAFLAGGAAAATQAAGGAAIATAYGMAAKAVKEDKVKAAQGYAVDYSFGKATEKSTHHAEVRARASQIAILRKTRTYNQAAKQVADLNGKLAGKLSLPSRVVTAAQKIRPSITAARTAQQIAGLEKYHNVMHVGSRLIPFVQLGYDLLSAYKEQKKRLEELEH